MADGSLNKPTFIVRTVKKQVHGHHGGAWKVAYADFVTAMMAFFLLLWLLNAVTEEQLHGVADYFAPMSASLSTKGTGKVGGGGYGNPFERAPEKVRDDLLDGYVTIKGARNDYGVVIDPATKAIDRAATAKLRAEGG